MLMEKLQKPMMIPKIGSIVNALSNMAWPLDRRRRGLMFALAITSYLPPDRIAVCMNPCS